MKKAVIFDWGQVMYGWDFDEIRADLKAGGGFVPQDVYNEEMLPYREQLWRGEITNNRYWETIAEWTGKPLPDDWEVQQETLFMTRLQPILGMADMVEQVKACGLKVACLSDIHELGVRLNRREKRYDAFDVVVLSSEVGMCRPHHDIFHYTLDQLGLPAEECLLIDDLPQNVAAARELGLDAIQFTNRQELGVHLAEYGL